MTETAASQDIATRIQELIDVIESARAVPLSASCVIHRGDVLEILDSVRLDLP